MSNPAYRAGSHADSSPDTDSDDCDAPEDDESWKLLDEIYYHCRKPLTLFQNTEELLTHKFVLEEAESEIEEMVKRKKLRKWYHIILVYLFHHVNRGLRYHKYQTAETFQNMESYHMAKVDIDRKCMEFDTIYQEEVYKSIQLVLAKLSKLGTMGSKDEELKLNLKFVHTRLRLSTLLTDIDLGWHECYQNKLIQNERRWKLLQRSGMETGKYVTFDPLCSHRAENNIGINLLHLAAWRGSARCLSLLVQHTNKSLLKQDINSETLDGRNALHFLYHYCNKPCDLPESTKILVRHGIDVNHSNSQDIFPLMILLPHIFVKRTYVRYLANTFVDDIFIPRITLPEGISAERTVTMSQISNMLLSREKPAWLVRKQQEMTRPKCDEENPLLWYDKVNQEFVMPDLSKEAHGRHGEEIPNNYHKEIKECIDILMEGGLDVNKSCVGRNLAQVIIQFYHVNVITCDKAFQVLGHEMVPYTYKLQPVWDFVAFLADRGLQVMEEKALTPPWHLLVSTFGDMCFDESLNPVQDILQCFHVLYHYGKSSNAKDQHGNSALDSLSKSSYIVHNLPPTTLYAIMEWYALHGSNLAIFVINVIEETIRNSSWELSNNEEKVVLRVITFALDLGVDPSIPVTRKKYGTVTSYLMTDFLTLHNVQHKSGFTSTPDSQTTFSDTLLTTQRRLCSTMDLDSLYTILELEQNSGVAGVKCMDVCPIFHMLQDEYCVRPLLHLCRRFIWQILRTRYLHKCSQLPLPAKMQTFLQNLIMD